ncbi:MAG: ATP synthase F1 subunit delta [FCB group bacterium]|nr:ATP synthase F1 subunit delta [FCB group bacterium]
MKLNRKAKQYASALINVAQHYNVVAEVGGSLGIISKLIKTDGVFRAFFHTTKIRPEDKTKILLAILKKQCHPIAAEFFGVLAGKREWHLFPRTAIVYREKQKDVLNLVSVNAYTARELEEDMRTHIRESLEQATGKKADFQVSVDPNLLGGIKLRIGNIVVDGSLQHRLQQLRQELLHT